MSDFINTFGGAAKDAANSTVLGAAHDTQYGNIATMSATKANKVISPTDGNLLAMTGSGDLQDAGVAMGAVYPGKEHFQVFDPSATLTTSYATLTGWPTEDLDPQGDFNPTTGYYTPSVAGVYYIKFGGVLSAEDTKDNSIEHGVAITHSSSGEINGQEWTTVQYEFAHPMGVPFALSGLAYCNGTSHYVYARVSGGLHASDCTLTDVSFMAFRISN